MWVFTGIVFLVILGLGESHRLGCRWITFTGKCPPDLKIRRCQTYRCPEISADIATTTTITSPTSTWFPSLNLLWLFSTTAPAETETSPGVETTTTTTNQNAVTTTWDQTTLEGSTRAAKKKRSNTRRRYWNRQHRQKQKKRRREMDPYAHHRSDRRYNSQGSGVRKRTGGFFASPTMTFKFPTIRFLLLFLFLHLAATAETNSQFKKVADGSSVGDYANTEPVENNNHTAVTMMMRINDSLSIGELPRSERKTRLRGERLRGERIRNDLKGPGLAAKRPEDSEGRLNTETFLATLGMLDNLTGLDMTAHPADPEGGVVNVTVHPADPEGWLDNMTALPADAENGLDSVTADSEDGLDSVAADAADGQAGESASEVAIGYVSRLRGGVEHVEHGTSPTQEDIKAVNRGAEEGGGTTTAAGGLHTVQTGISHLNNNKAGNLEGEEDTVTTQEDAKAMNGKEEEEGGSITTAAGGLRAMQAEIGGHLNNNNQTGGLEGEEGVVDKDTIIHRLLMALGLRQVAPAFSHDCGDHIVEGRIEIREVCVLYPSNITVLCGFPDVAPVGEAFNTHCLIISRHEKEAGGGTNYAVVGGVTSAMIILFVVAALGVWRYIIHPGATGPTGAAPLDDSEGTPLSNTPSSEETNGEEGEGAGTGESALVRAARVVRRLAEGGEVHDGVQDPVEAGVEAHPECGRADAAGLLNETSPFIIHVN